jgi:hypothetical protein
MEYFISSTYSEVTKSKFTVHTFRNVKYKDDMSLTPLLFSLVDCYLAHLTFAPGNTIQDSLASDSSASIRRTGGFAAG